MKVGEAGEAFFVLETDEEVPIELLTSPVVLASDVSRRIPIRHVRLVNDIQSDYQFPPPLLDEAPSPEAELQPASQDNEADASGPSLTQQPFGATEVQMEHSQHLDGTNAEAGPSSRRTDGLDIDVLDLNEPIPEAEENDSPSKKGASSRASVIAPSSLLNTATSILPSMPSMPSIPFLSSSSNSRKGSKESSVSGEEPDKAMGAKLDMSKAEKKAFVAKNAPNPMTAQPGESTDLPEKDEKLSKLSEKDDVKTTGGETTSSAVQGPESKLPRVQKGEGDGPEVVYGKDIVLDMGGYHSMGEGTEEREPLAAEGMRKEVEMVRRREASQEGRHKEGARSKDVKDPGMPTNTGTSSDVLARGSPTANANQVQAGQENDDQQERVVEKALELGAVTAALVETFALDLLASANPPSNSLRPASRPKAPTRATEPSIPLSPSPSKKSLPQVSIDSSPSNELHSAIESLSLETDHPDTQTPPRRSRYDRGQSEPPQSPESFTPSHSSHPSLSLIPNRMPTIIPNSPTRITRATNGTLRVASPITVQSGQPLNVAMDHAWDWGRLPSQTKTDGDVDDIAVENQETGVPTADHLERTRSVPAAVMDGDLRREASGSSDLSSAQPGKLKNLEEDPFMFVLEMSDGRTHTFELALCGAESFAPDGAASVSLLVCHIPGPAFRGRELNRIRIKMNPSSCATE
jgi:phosphatidate phosphatase LPIN